MRSKDKTARRAAKQAWKDREPEWALCKVTVGSSVWVSVVADPAAFERRIGFTLRTGSAPSPDMAAAYREAGAVEVAVVERFDAELSAMARETHAAARLAHWAERLGARRL